MTTNKKNSQVDIFVRQATQWRREMEELRRIILECHLMEDLKWSKPCYAFKGGNVVIIQPFKKYCALLFFKGFLLKDPDGILVRTGENTVVGRQIRFTDVQDIVTMEPVLKSYIRQAIEVEKSGVKLPVEEPKLKIPAEFQKTLNELPALKKAFEALTPGRQRGYGYFFSAPKKSETRTARVEKWTPQILKGKGMLD